MWPELKFTTFLWHKLFSSLKKQLKVIAASNIFWIIEWRQGIIFSSLPSNFEMRPRNLSECVRARVTRETNWKEVILVSACERESWKQVAQTTEESRRRRRSQNLICGFNAFPDFVGFGSFQRVPFFFGRFQSLRLRVQREKEKVRKRQKERLLLL